MSKLPETREKDMSHLSLALLGGFQTTLDGTPITAFETDRGRALLAYLAAEASRPHRRDALTGLLWPNMPEPSARHNLSQCLFNLRQALGDHQAEPPFLLISRETLQFNSTSQHTLDLATFTALLNACDAHPHPQLETCRLCIPRLQQAVELYRGDFLAHFFLADSAAFEEWALVQRESLHLRAMAALAALADSYEQDGDAAAGIRICRRQLELDPWREESHRQMMRLLAGSGQRSAALAQYETCRRVLASELGVEPAAETKALYQQIKDEGGILRVKDEEKPPFSRGAFFLHSSALPTPLTPFLGRERELSELDHMLADPACRLVTLVGPGGIGKTRLALQVAASKQATFTQGAAFVSLASLTSANLFIPAVAAAAGLTFYGASDPQIQLLNYLREKRVLLVLDNIEHLLPDPQVITCVGEILQTAPAVKLLATSREPLNMQGEWVFEVEGLGEPAALLFAQSARRARASFELGAEDQAAVTQICRLVDGLPLGIELAASWVRVLSCTEIAREIERNLDFLTTSARDVSERHRSMRAVFDHSWQLLSAEERQGIQHLAVFRGGFHRTAAEEVAGVSLGLLSALVSKSLLRRTAADRYDLHELTRQYAVARLQEEPQAEQAARNRHAVFYLTMLQAYEPTLFSRRQKEALAELNAELDNIRAAWEAAVAQRQLDLLRHPSFALLYFYNVRNYFQEGEILFQRAAGMVQTWLAEIEADAAASERTGLEAGWGDLLAHQAYFTRRQGRNAEAVQLYQASLALLRMQPEPEALARTLTLYGALCWTMGEFDEAWRCLQDSLPIFQDLKHEWQQALCLALMGMVMHEQGAYPEAYRFLNQAMTRFRALGDPHIITFVGNFFSRTAQALGRTAEVRDLLEEGLQLAQETGDRFSMGLMFERLAIVAQAEGDETEARRLLVEGIVRYRDVGDPWSLSRALNLLGHLAWEVGDVPQARASFRQALQTAVATQVTPGALDALAGLATLAAQEGQSEAALSLVMCILAHPASSQEAKDRAGRLLTEIETRLPLAQIEAVRAQTEFKGFETVVAELLQPWPLLY
jgi:predicted ATPase